MDIGKVTYKSVKKKVKERLARLLKNFSTFTFFFFFLEKSITYYFFSKYSSIEKRPRGFKATFMDIGKITYKSVREKLKERFSPTFEKIFNFYFFLFFLGKKYNILFFLKVQQYRKEPM